MVKGLRKLPYMERLVRLQLPTLKFRRIRGDMIEVSKVLTCKYDAQVCPSIPKSDNVNTRENSMKLQSERTKYYIRKNFFTNKVVKI